MTKVKRLTQYKEKRNFTTTPEPEPKIKSSAHKNIFVIQKHDASHLHYDFRIEMDGVLKSWAIPKGPSSDPGQKRLAMLTEDHPLDYAHFEGIIPEGYGAGTVIVWDTGTYENVSEKDGKNISIEEAFKNGHIKLILHGKKLHGGYTLTLFKPKEQAWLFIKENDKYANRTEDITQEKPGSVLSKMTIEKLNKEFNEQKKER